MIVMTEIPNSILKIYLYQINHTGALAMMKVMVKVLKRRLHGVSLKTICI